MDRKKTLKANLEFVTNKIEHYKVVDTVTLVAVSKYSDFDDIRIMYELGHRDFGENRLESLSLKAQEAQSLGLTDIRWHFIGNLQANKIKEISNIPNLYAVHSIYKEKQISLFKEYLKKPIQFFVQVNTSDEEQKQGVYTLEEIRKLKALEGENFTFVGLMTMGKLSGDNQEADAKKCFEKLKQLGKELQATKFSMGMSGDYEIALSTGATDIRVGSSLFK